MGDWTDDQPDDQATERKLAIVTGMLRDVSTAILQERSKTHLQKMAHDIQKYLVMGRTRL